MTAGVKIASALLSASVDPLGAELCSLEDSEGRQYLFDGDPAWWAGRAPLLFPIVGGLNGGRYRLDGRDHALPRHGFARRSWFELIDRTAASARFRLTDSVATRSAYPFAFVLEVAFALAGATLTIEATVRNPGGEPLPFSFGFHPAFAWPLPGGGERLDHRIEFERAEPAAIRRLDGDGLLGASEASPVAGRVLAPRPEMFAADALIWDRLASRALIYRAGAGGPALRIAFHDMPFLGIWQKPGAPFLAIEPWAGIADPARFDGDFRAKPDIMELAPGAARRFCMEVTVEPGEGSAR